MIDQFLSDPHKYNNINRPYDKSLSRKRRNAATGTCSTSWRALHNDAVSRSVRQLARQPPARPSLSIYISVRLHGSLSACWPFHIHACTHFSIMPLRPCMRIYVRRPAFVSLFSFFTTEITPIIDILRVGDVADNVRISVIQLVLHLVHISYI